MKWERERGAGLGKAFKPGFELGTAHSNLTMIIIIVVIIIIIIIIIIVIIIIIC